MNLRQGNGRVPIQAPGGDPWEFTWVLIDWPTREQFDAIYSEHYPKMTATNRDRYWGILRARSQGSTLQAAGAPFQVTRERVRQLEAQFRRRMQQWHFSKTEKLQKSHVPASNH